MGLAVKPKRPSPLASPLTYAASMSSAVDFSDAALFAMSIPNLIGVYLMVPIVRKEYREYLAYTKRIDEGHSVDETE